jgi:hypothetical protein
MMVRRRPQAAWQQERTEDGTAGAKAGQQQTA